MQMVSVLECREDITIMQKFSVLFAAVTNLGFCFWFCQCTLCVVLCLTHNYTVIHTIKWLSFVGIRKLSPCEALDTEGLTQKATTAEGLSLDPLTKNEHLQILQ